MIKNNRHHFLHRLTDLGYDNLKTIETKEDGRRYITPEGNLYPSITTVLGAMDSDWLEEWKSRVGHKYAETVGHHARTRGTALHNAFEKYLLNKREWFQSNEMPHIKALFKGSRPILDRFINKIHALEIPLYSDHLKLAGRADVIAEYNQRLSVIDFKTASRFKTEADIKNYLMQSAAYAIMYEERTGIPIMQLVIIIAVDNQPAPTVIISSRDKYTSALTTTIKNYYDTYNR